MYQFSRSIYRELAPRVIEDPADGTGCAAKQRVLDTCEEAMRRLAQDRRYFARPSRWLFTEVRAHFALSDQLHVFKVVDGYVRLALAYLDSLPEEELSLLGLPAQCQALTRKGTACQREPLPGREYCPSHKHLEETFGMHESESEVPVGLEEIGVAA